MKTELTVGESRLLIALGAPKEKARCERPIGDGEYVFSLADLLEILPKVLYKEGLAYAYNLELCWREEDNVWRVVYDAIGDSMGYFTGEELIDALCALTGWYYGDFLKSEKK